MAIKNEKKQVDIDNKHTISIINAVIDSWELTENPLFIAKDVIDKRVEEITKCVCMSQGYNFEKIKKNDRRFKEFISSRIGQEVYEVSKFYYIKYCDDINLKWYDEHKDKYGESSRFEAFKSSLEGTKLSSCAINNLDINSNKIMSLISNPNIEVDKEKNKLVVFKKIGLIMGDVQSGKTLLITAAINKALDAGYKLIIIIAGTKSNLRNQLQERIEDGIYGINMDKSCLTGIGKYLTQEELDEIFMYTTRDKFINNKFKSGELPNKGYNTMLMKNKKVILVCKRQYQVTERIISWVKAQVGLYNTETGKLEGVPTIIIADEADEATINVGNMEEISKNNKNTRELINMINQVNYIGLSATPFANIYIDPNDNDKEVGDDLFPKDFLCYFEPSNSYVGGNTFFRKNSPYVYLATESDFNTLDSDFTTREDNPELINLLRKSINNFILVTAIRTLRGYENRYNTMLVHVDRKTLPQSKLKNVINNYLDYLRHNIEIGGNIIFDKEILDLWNDIKINTIRVKEIDSKNQIANEYRVDFSDEDILEEVRNCLIRKLRNGQYRMNVKEINSTANGERLDYNNETEDVIAIGGQVLSRGYTLEGLTISLLLRESLQMDTLLQNCRFFSHYSSDYRDLVKLYTSKQINEWLEMSNDGKNIIIDQVKDMDKQEKTPLDFGLYMNRVRAKFESNKIIDPTSKNKMKNAKFQGKNGYEEGNYNGIMFEMATFFSGKYGDRVNSKNLIELDKFIAKLENFKIEPGKYKEDENIVWSDINPIMIKEFLRNIEIPPTSRLSQKANKELLISQVDRAINQKEINTLDVVLINNFYQGEVPGEKFTYLEHPIIPVNRRTSKQDKYDKTYMTAHGKSTQNRDLKYGLTDEEIEYIKYNYGRSYKDSNPPKEECMKVVRTNRKAALLLIYIQNAKLISESGKVRGFLDEVSVNPISFSFFFPGEKKTIPIIANKTYVKRMKEVLESISKGRI